MLCLTRLCLPCDSWWPCQISPRADSVVTLCHEYWLHAHGSEPHSPAVCPHNEDFRTYTLCWDVCLPSLCWVLTHIQSSWVWVITIVNQKLVGEHPNKDKFHHLGDIHWRYQGVDPQLSGPDAPVGLMLECAAYELSSCTCISHTLHLLLL